MKTLGHIAGEREMMEHQASLVGLLKSNQIAYSAGGSKVVEVDVPASKLDLAVALLRTNPLVLDGHFLLYTNAPNKK